MELNGQINRRIIIFSLGAIILPLVAFPARLGTEIARASLFNALYELVYFGVVIYFFHRRTTLLKLVQGAGMCLIYRLALGAVFGLLLAAVYSMQVRVSLTLGMSGYLPAILFHVVLAPFILKPVLSQLNPEGSERRSPTIPLKTTPKVEEKSIPPVAATQHPVAANPHPTSAFAAPRRVEATVSPKRTESFSGIAREANGFGRAVSYICEHVSVNLAVVVDNEGLLLAGSKRGQIDLEEWAPLALLLVDGSQQVLQRGQMNGLEKVDLMLKEKRLIVARPEGCYLMVVAERHDDDLLNIRINQALEMIGRFATERYGSKMNPNAERIHVPSA
jgi:predicted regulator of Ras-like GTPase activity (Roadblock/LC7/MglB family)